MDFARLMEVALETILMVVTSTVIAYIIGLPVGVLLYYTSKKGLKPNRVINMIVGTIVNVFRSIPCLLLIIILIDVTSALVGDWVGSWETMIVPLVVASFGFIARMVEQSLSEVPSGVVEASRAMGASNWQIILKVLLPEAKPSLVSGFAVAVVSIVGYTAFSGYISAGGLISEGFNSGYYGSNTTMMWLCVLCVVIIVQIIQEGGLYIAKKLDKRRK